MNRTSPPDWDNLPETIPSTEVAALFGIYPKTLSKYVNRGIMAAPVERGTNHALYRKSDVVAFWHQRERRKAQGYIKDDAKDRPRPGGGDMAESPGTIPPSDLVTLTQESLAALLTEAVAEGVRQGNEGLRAEFAGLREGLAAARTEAGGQSAGEGTEPPTNWLVRLLTGKW